MLVLLRVNDLTWVSSWPVEGDGPMLFNGRHYFLATDGDKAERFDTINKLSDVADHVKEKYPGSRLQIISLTDFGDSD